MFHSLSSCSFLFLVYVRHFLSHTINFLASPLAQSPRQPTSSPNGSAGTGRSAHPTNEPYLALGGVRLRSIVLSARLQLIDFCRCRWHHSRIGVADGESQRAGNLRMESRFCAKGLIIFRVEVIGNNWRFKVF